MSHPVDRLKELLFDSEARVLSDVQQRLERSETEIRSEARERQAFANRLDEVFSRAGTEERFRTAVANVLDTALRRAETERHKELSEAVAPLIVRTIRMEILNSRDELVDALYPITGRMVKAYVASAITDLALQINRRVDSNPLILRMRSVVSGKSVAELALADANTLQLQELYLIRRGTGELVGHWPQVDSDNRGQVMSGVLAAINEFASDAFGEGGKTLRNVDMGDSCVYLRASPLYLLAARCTGAAPAEAARLIDDCFLSAIENFKAAADGQSSTAAFQGRLGRLSEDLTAGFARLPTHRQGSRVSPFTVLLSLIALSAVAFGAWFALDRHFVASARDTVNAAIAATPGTLGYPIDVNVSSFARRVSLTGLTQDETVKSNILQRLRQELPRATIEDHLAPLPGATGEISATIAREAIKGALHRAALKLEQVTINLQQVFPTIDQDAQREAVAHAITLTGKSVKDLRNQSSDLQGEPSARVALSEQLNQIATDVEAATTGQSSQQSDRPPPAKGAITATESASSIELAADRLAVVTAAVLQANALKRSLPPPEPAVVRAPDITAFERLTVWVKSHAVFFGEDLAYRDETGTRATLDDLAKLMRETEALVRIVGYTDAKGTTDRNTALSEDRARKVADALIERGVPAARLVVVGRQDANQIASRVGDTSPNRRVEFELGFDGEGSE